MLPRHLEDERREGVEGRKLVHPRPGAEVRAGVYQFSPLKRACLTQCRSPVNFLTAHWRPGVAGSFLLGMRHGIYCVGCCWLLMALLFVGGIMNLIWIAALSLIVFVEKILPGGERVGRVLGVVLIAWAGVTLLV